MSDEAQLMHQSTWGEVGAPMLLDNDGEAVFIYTPPSIANQAHSKARDPSWMSKLFKRAQQDPSERWATFHFFSHANPYISRQALADLTSDMTALAIRQEIEAEDIDQTPGMLWTRVQLEGMRVSKAAELTRIVAAVDPSATTTGDEAEIIVAGLGMDSYGYVLADLSLQGSPQEWAQTAVSAYNTWKADRLVVEFNQGGAMVKLTIQTIPDAPPVKLVHASRGKQAGAEPIAALSEQGKIHLVGSFPHLEKELC